MESLVSIKHGETPKKEKRKSFCKKTRSFFRSLYKPFRLAPERKVLRPEMTAKDFELPEECWVAIYDPKLVAKYWNERSLPRKLGTICVDLFVKGIISKLVPIWLLYLLAYYVLNPYVFNKMLCHQTTNTTGGQDIVKTGYVRVALSFGQDQWCHKGKFDSWNQMERDFTKVLTFFIGFTVSISVRNWFQQVKMVPHLDAILIQINNYVWVNSSRNSDEFNVKMGMTPNEFRKTIIRYFLLSWTMCMSRMCKKLNETLGQEGSLNKKRLLLKREFEELNYGTLGKSWREKWSSPLGWIAKMANDPKLKGLEAVKILDVKDAIGKSLNAYCHNLQQLNGFNEYRIPTSLLTLLTLAIYMFMILSFISGQDMYPNEFPGNNVMTVLIDAPYFDLIKFSLIFGWLRVATDLMVPFETDRYISHMYFIKN